MAMKRGRPGVNSERKSTATGPDYSSERFRNPFNGPGIDYECGSEESKTINSPTATIEGMGLPLHHDYDAYWEKGK